MVCLISPLSWVTITLSLHDSWWKIYKFMYQTSNLIYEKRGVYYEEIMDSKCPTVTEKV